MEGEFVALAPSDAFTLARSHGRGNGDVLQMEGMEGELVALAPPVALTLALSHGRGNGDVLQVEGMGRVCTP